MCGIVGFLTDKEFDSQTILGMTKELVHRGPDSEGIWFDNEVGMALGHTRLAILDLSENGKQPMISPSGRYVISYNGEIYNHLKIRKEINKSTSQNISWKGNSDTETILHSFDTWGVKKSLKNFTGQFAFGVWDRKKKKLLLVRDRFGEKPLYYGFIKDSFIFASELKAFNPIPGFSPSIDNTALNLYLKFNYVPSPYSIYNNIYKLMPGSILEISNPNIDLSNIDLPLGTVNQADFKISTWWSIDHIKEQRDAVLEFEEAKNTIEDKLKESIELQSISDVPIGCFLSGGIDSSLIATLMQNNSSQPINTFTVGFEEEGYNEANYAREIAKKIGSNHNEISVTSREAQEVVPLLSSIYDEPFSDVSQIPSYLISKLAKKHVTVVLSGDAGDELFGGYNRYRFAPSLWSIIRLVPFTLRKLIFNIMLMIPIATINKGSSLFPKRFSLSLLGEKMHRNLHKLIDVKNETELYIKLVSLWQEEDNVLVEDRKVNSLPSFIGRKADERTFEENMMFYDAKTYLTDDILVKVDRASMSNSLETRVPFLNHELYELSTKVDIDQKIKRNKGKIILMSIFKKYYPEIDLNRPKQGFSVPIGEWLRGPLQDWAQKLLDPVRLENEGFFNAAIIDQHWKEHLSGKKNWDHKLWNILIFQSWLEHQNYEKS